MKSGEKRREMDKALLCLTFLSLLNFDRISLENRMNPAESDFNHVLRYVTKEFDEQASD